MNEVHEMKTLALQDEVFNSFPDQQARSDVLKKLPLPDGTAQVGQYLRVLSVDADGKITGVEAADAPAGGSDSGGNVDEETVQDAVDEYLENNSQSMATLTINGQQYNGSEDVVVEIVSDGGGTESAAEKQLATGTITAETAANTTIDTGITLETLKQYKRFVFVFKGATNTGLANTYLMFLSTNKAAIVRFGSAGLKCGFEWVNADEGLLRIYALFSGNPSLVGTIGTAFIRSYPYADIGNGVVGSGGIELYDVSSAEDTDTLKIYISSATTIEYAWEIRGLTV